MWQLVVATHLYAVYVYSVTLLLCLPLLHALIGWSDPVVHNNTCPATDGRSASVRQVSARGDAALLSVIISLL